jgi:SPP1 gp7 family putative phage head morphogenesis protein
VSAVLSRAFDEARHKSKRSKRTAAFGGVRKAEKQYAVALRKVARHVGDMVTDFDFEQPDAADRLQDVLDQYADVIEPWARAATARMIADVSNRDRRAWKQASQNLSRTLRVEIESAPTGSAMRELLAEQVSLIRSLPIEAGQRVHRLTIEGLMDSTRASEIAEEIRRSGEVTESRATLIARTEVARTAATLTQMRAQHIGSDGYIWRTVEDSDVRPSHRRMNGKFIAWNDPPTLDNMVGHAGMLPNCRCYPEPVIPDEL